MSLEKLKKYRVNSGYTEGVVITLDDAPDVECRVVLPGKHNRAYIAEIYGAIELSVEGEDATLKTSVIDAQEHQEAAFLKHCLKSIDDEPVPESFARDYPDALAEIMRKAKEHAQSLEKDTERAITAVRDYLAWEHRWSGRLEFYRKLVEKGRVDDEDLMPEVGRYAPILSAFREVSTERQIGVAVGPIPASKVTEHLERHGLPYWWEDVIAAADAKAMELNAEESRKKAS